MYIFVQCEEEEEGAEENAFEDGRMIHDGGSLFEKILVLFTAAHCNTRRCTVTHYNTLQRTAAYCSALPHTVTHSSTL